MAWAPIISENTEDWINLDVVTALRSASGGWAAQNADGTCLGVVDDSYASILLDSGPIIPANGGVQATILSWGREALYGCVDVCQLPIVAWSIDRRDSCARPIVAGSIPAGSRVLISRGNGSYCAYGHDDVWWTLDDAIKAYAKHQIETIELKRKNAS
jgi:hypothetical protein